MPLSRERGDMSLSASPCSQSSLTNDSQAFRAGVFFLHAEPPCERASTCASRLEWEKMRTAWNGVVDRGAGAFAGGEAVMEKRQI